MVRDPAQIEPADLGQPASVDATHDVVSHTPRMARQPEPDAIIVGIDAECGLQDPDRCLEQSNSVGLAMRGAVRWSNLDEGDSTLTQLPEESVQASIAQDVTDGSAKRPAGIEKSVGPLTIRLPPRKADVSKGSFCTLCTACTFLTPHDSCAAGTAHRRGREFTPSSQHKGHSAQARH